MEFMILQRFKLFCLIVIVTALFGTFPTLVLAQSSGAAIGRVETLAGNARATRNNRKIEKLAVGDPIFTGDSVQTGTKSRLGITFLDHSVFSLSANAKMVINDLVYNLNSNSNKLLVGLAEGGFVFLAGKIAKSGNMVIDTPLAHIGIRGTQPWVTIGSTSSFTIMSERDGTTGEYFLLRKGTSKVIATVNLATVGTTKKYVMSSPTDDPRLVDKTPAELQLEPQLKRAFSATLQARDARLRQQPKRKSEIPAKPGFKTKTDSYYDVSDPSSNKVLEIKIERIAPLNSPGKVNTDVYKMINGEWIKIPEPSKLYTYIMNVVAIPPAPDLDEITGKNPLADFPIFDIGVRPAS